MADGTTDDGLPVVVLSGDTLVLHHAPDSESGPLFRMHCGIEAQGLTLAWGDSDENALFDTIDACPICFVSIDEDELIAEEG